MNSPSIVPSSFIEKPMKLSGSLKDFEKGVLCYVIAVRYQGRGPVKMIFHEADAVGKDSFAYGAKRHWVVSPGTLMGMNRSESKAKASRANGTKGGRPKRSSVVATTCK